jgi:hypothetical protein
MIRFNVRSIAATVATLLVLGLATWESLAQASTSNPSAAMERYDGMCEASAAVALDSQHFVVGDDESNALNVYRIGQSAPARPAVDLAAFLATGDKASDIEGATRIGDTIYWISSHSRTSSGKARPWRRRLFATQVDLGASPPTVRPVGKPYVNLIEDLASAPELKGLGLGKAADIAPEQPGGLNIEGLADTADGHLLVGFRNPLKDGKALLVPITNPAALVVGNGARPAFGPPALLDLGGRGIRSMERIGAVYWIVAGPTGDVGSFALYAWDGVPTHPATPAPVALPAQFSAEALFALPGTGQAMLLSDDGALRVEGTRCDQLDKAKQRFRALRIPFQK